MINVQLYTETNFSLENTHTVSYKTIGHIVQFTSRNIIDRGVPVLRNL